MSLILVTAFVSMAGAAPNPGAFPGGLHDPQGKYAFIADEKGGLDAFDLMSGRTVWHRDDLATPLLVENGVLYARATGDGLRVIRADATTGKTRSEVTLPVPTWFYAADGGVHEVEISTCVTGSALHIDWHATVSQPTVGGTIPGDGPLKVRQAKTRWHHEADDRVDVLPDGKVIASSAWCPVAPSYSSSSFAGQGRTIYAVTRSATGYEVIAWDAAQQAVVRERWTASRFDGTSTRAETTRLGTDTQARTSVDRSTVFVKSSDRAGRVWDAATGTSTHELAIQGAAFDQFALLGGRVYCLAFAPGPTGAGRYGRRTLKAFDAATGKELWSVAASGAVAPLPPVP